ncbi:YfcE family phosphodiesterase [Candidatus Falkowbacteria bacterium]|jgi:putative phosphoesterase|nr:YfcE family phosphodiesterase [Candidatus Falkowbacteria bacterium]
MLIAVISDIHDNLACLEKCLTWCKQNHIAQIICCGDISNTETVNYLAQNFLGEIFIVAGNNELYEEKDLMRFSHIHFGGDISINEIDGLNIGLCHQPEKIKKVQELAPFNLDFIFYGHTHKPDLKKEGSTIIANPGTLGGVFTPATFAVLDTGKKNLELKRLTDL